jgi:hypothetical protein
MPNKALVFIPEHPYSHILLQITIKHVISISTKSETAHCLMSS